MPYKVWATGQEVHSAEFNSMVAEQVIATFATAAARDAAILTPRVGQYAWTADTLSLWVYVAGAWILTGAGPKGPRGQLAIMELTANAADSGATTPTAIPGLTTPALVTDGTRRWQIRAEMQITGTGTTSPGTYAELQLREDPAKQIQLGRFAMPPAGQNFNCQTERTYAPAAGTYTYTACIGRNAAGAGTLAVLGATTRPAYLVVTDMGGV
jgi:hypothetical protein